MDKKILEAPLMGIIINSIVPVTDSALLVDKLIGLFALVKDNLDNSLAYMRCKSLHKRSIIK